MRWVSQRKGFTIVELLIVIVVIAILAAITIVAYNGVSQRARASSAQTAASQVSKKVATYNVTNDIYPTTLDALKIFSDAGVSYQYSVNNSTTPKGYCVTASSGGVSYYLAENFTHTISGGGTVNQPSPAAGACPGHNANGIPTITNLATNPSFETNVTGTSNPNGSTVVRSTTRAYSGTASAEVTMPANVLGSNVGAGFLKYVDFTGELEPYTLYTASIWVYVPTGTNNVFLSVQGAGKDYLADPPERLVAVKNQWARAFNTFETTGSGTVSLLILNSGTSASTPSKFWMDGGMLVKGSRPPNYGDGSTDGWSWGGTPQSSISFGPASF